MANARSSRNYLHSLNINFVKLSTINIILCLAFLLAKWHTSYSALADTTILHSENSSKSLKQLHVAWAFSPTDLMFLAEREAELYTLITGFKSLATSEQQLSHIQTWLSDYEASTLLGTSDILNRTENETDTYKAALSEAVAAHPLMSFRMIRRFVRILPDILSSDISNTTDLFKQMEKLNSLVLLPLEADLNDVMDNILRITETYSLNPANIIGGKIGERKTKVGLTLEMAFEIALEALRNEMYTQSSSWLTTVYQMAQHENHSGMLHPENILGIIDELKLEHDALIDEVLQNQHNLNYVDKHFHRFTAKLSSELDSDFYLETIKEYVERQLYSKNFKPSDLHQAAFNIRNYELLCDGITFQPEAIKSKLYCWYESKRDMVWLIGPLKMELLDERINLVQIHDVIGDGMIQRIREAGEKSMVRARVADQNITSAPNPSGRISDYRTASISFLKNNTWLHNLDKKIGRVTGLVVASSQHTMASELLQAASSAFGGHYGPHLDVLGAKKSADVERNGDRFATLMLYLNDVELGGHTVFTRLGIAVVPKKGSAIFWYNMKRNGDQQLLSEHAGCPVLFGQKWVANKWIREHANFQARKCSIDAFV